MVQGVVFLNEIPFVRGQKFLDCREVQRGDDLAVPAAVDSHYGAAGGGDVVGRVVVDEPAQPGVAFEPDVLAVHLFRHHAGLAGKLHDAVDLGGEGPVAAHSRTGEADHEVDRAARAQHEGYGRALAMADDAYFRESAAAPEELHGRERVLHEILRGGVLHVAAGRFAEAAVVVAQRGYPVASEVVGDDQEGLVAEYLLVAVLLPAAADHHHSCGSSAFSVAVNRKSAADRPGKGAGKSRSGGFVGETDLLGAVREGRLRGLGTVQHLLSPGEGERKRESVLAEAAHDAAAVEHSAEGGRQGGYFHSHRRQRGGVKLGLNAFGSLVGAVHRRDETSVIRRLEIEDQGQFGLSYTYLSVPDALEQGGGGLGGC